MTASRRPRFFALKSMLGEAVGLPVFTMLGTALGANEPAVARVMKDLRADDITFRRLTDVQPFRSDDQSIKRLLTRINTALATSVVV